MKTTELTGVALDWAVAQAEKDRDEGIFYDEDYDSMGFYDHDDVFCPYQPSEDWAQGGPIIERENATLTIFGAVPEWFSAMDNGEVKRVSAIGKTPLEAAMRCYVACKLGGEVEIPKELL